MELTDNNSRVDAVSSAVAETPIYGNVIDPEKVHDPLQGFKGLPSIRRIGKPNGVAAAIDFLLPPNSAWVSGSVLDVDGGLMRARRN